VKSLNIGQILDSEYPTINSSAIKSIINVMDGKSMDENRTYLLASIGTFCLFVEMIFNKKTMQKGHQ
jgi:hypothetical protein